MDVINAISKRPGLPDAPVTIPRSDANPDNLQPAASMFLDGPHVHEYLREMHDKVLSREPLHCATGIEEGEGTDDGCRLRRRHCRRMLGTRQSAERAQVRGP